MELLLMKAAFASYQNGDSNLPGEWILISTKKQRKTNQSNNLAGLRCLETVINVIGWDRALLRKITVSLLQWQLNAPGVHCRAFLRPPAIPWFLRDR